MAKAIGRARGDDQVRLLEDLLIVQLTMAGVPQREVDLPRFSGQGNTDRFGIR
jgi:hypothetical protein